MDRCGEKPIHTYSIRKRLCYGSIRPREALALCQTSDRKEQGLVITQEIDALLDLALRTVNPNHNTCSEKNRRIINEKKIHYGNDRKRSALNAKSELLTALEDNIEEAAVEIVKAAVDNLDDPRQLKALIESIQLLADEPTATTNETSETETEYDSEDAYAEAEASLEACHSDDEDEAEGR